MQTGVQGLNIKFAGPDADGEGAVAHLRCEGKLFTSFSEMREGPGMAHIVEEKIRVSRLHVEGKVVRAKFYENVVPYLLRSSKERPDKPQAMLAGDRDGNHVYVTCLPRLGRSQGGRTKIIEDQVAG
jgi:hypothetical protein